VWLTKALMSGVANRSLQAMLMSNAACSSETGTVRQQRAGAVW
jgi:hypothetical protein